MEKKKLLNRNNDKEKNKEYLYFKKKLRFYINIASIYLRQYYRMIIITIIFFFIIIKVSNKRNTNSELENSIKELNNIDSGFKSEILNNYKNEAKDNQNKVEIIDNKENQEKKENLINNKKEIQHNKNEEILFEEEDEIDSKNDNKSVNITNILKKVNEYIHICNEEILLDGIKQSSKNPKISAVIASYNSENTIKAAIKSIQNQKMSDIEIIIVDDASTDNSLNLIKELQKKDSRIKIIQNKENMGPLYSKSIGCLEARGKYIMQLDSDDLFINENIFNICYNESENNNIDILEFSGFRSKTQYLNESAKPRIPLYLRFKENNLTVYQPELSNFIYKKRINRIIRLIDGYLWGKCIKSEIYRKALDTLGEELYTQKIFYGDDRIVNFILFKVANSFKFIEEYGIIYYSTKNSILNSNKKRRNCHDELINIQNIFNFTKNSLDSQIAAYEIIFRWKKLILPGLNKENKKYAKNLLNQMIKCKYISKKNRKYINNLLISIN